MAFPTAIDNFSSPASTDYQNSPSHSTQHTNVNGAVAAIEAKVGIGASPASTAVDGYILMADGAGNTAWEKAAPVLTTDADAATITFDMNTSNVHSVTLGANRILAVSNVAVGQVFILRVVQDGGGSRTVTWFSTIKWTGGSAPTLTTTGGKTDVFGFLCTSAGNYDGYIVGLNL